MAHGTEQAILGLGRGENSVTDPVDNSLDALATTTAELATQVAALAAHAAATQTTGVHGLPKVSVVAGENETVTTQITVTGMVATDTVVAVLVLTTAASIATLAAHGGTLTAAAGKITPGTPVDNTGNQYVVFWIDKA